MRLLMIYSVFSCTNPVDWECHNSDMITSLSRKVFLIAQGWAPVQGHKQHIVVSVILCSHPVFSFQHSDVCQPHQFENSGKSNVK